MARTQLNLKPQTERIIMTKNLTFNNGKKFVEHVLPEPTEGPVPALQKSANRLTDQATKLRAERDQAQATVSAQRSK